MLSIFSSEQITKVILILAGIGSVGPFLIKTIIEAFKVPIHDITEGLGGWGILLFLSWIIAVSIVYVSYKIKS